MSVPAGCVGPAVGVPGPPDDVLEWLTAPAPRDRPATSADAASTSDGDSDMMSMIVTLYKSGMVNLFFSKVLFSKRPRVSEFTHVNEIRGLESYILHPSRQSCYIIFLHSVLKAN